MGQVHARALSRLTQHYTDSPLRPRLVAVADTADDDRTERAAQAFGFEHQLTDWRELVTRDDVDLVCVTGPNFIHRDVAVAAAEAGKHLWVEKPAGRNAAETAEIVAAVDAAGVQTAAGFNYRNAPAVELARELVASGRLGTVEHTSVRFVSRLRRAPRRRAVVAVPQRVRRQRRARRPGQPRGRPGPLRRGRHRRAHRRPGDVHPAAARGPARCACTTSAAPARWAPVENEDYVSALLRLRRRLARHPRGEPRRRSGSRTRTASRCTARRARSSGTSGAWASCRSASTRTTRTRSTRRATSTPGDGELGAFQPGANNPMGFDDLKVIEAAPAGAVDRRRQAARRHHP